MDSTRTSSTVALQGQGATEYLVVLGVVLVIALVSISLLGYFPDTVRDTSAASTQLYWQSNARPLRVLDVTQTDQTSLGFTMENAEVDPMSLKGVKIDDAPARFADGTSLLSNSSTINFGAGERKVVNVEVDSFPCTQGNTKYVALSFDYQTAFGTAMKQTSDKKLSVQCNYGSGSGSQASPTCVAQGGNCTDTLNCCLNLTCSAGACVQSGGNQTNNTTVSVWCYQETATQATACGAVGGGSYSAQFNDASQWRDGDWSTFNELSGGYYGDLYVNYVKPPNVNGTPMWQIKYGDPPVGTLIKPVPASCFNAYPNALSFRISYSDDTSLLKFYCYNGIAPNGGWNAVWTFTGGRYAVYEEGINWTLTVPG